MVTLPVVHIQNGQPELAPGRRADRAAKLVQACARLHGDRVVRFQAEDAGSAVVERGSEDCTWALDVAGECRSATRIAMVRNEQVAVMGERSYL